MNLGSVRRAGGTRGTGSLAVRIRKDDVEASGEIEADDVWRLGLGSRVEERASTKSPRARRGLPYV